MADNLLVNLILSATVKGFEKVSAEVNKLDASLKKVTTSSSSLNAVQKALQGTFDRGFGTKLDNYLNQTRTRYMELGDALKEFEKSQKSATVAQKTGFEGLGAGIEKLKGFGLQVAAVGVALYGLKKAADAAFEFGKLGAMAYQTGESFDFLVNKVGRNTVDAMASMRKGAGGVIDDMTLMGGVMNVVAGQSDEFTRTVIDAAPKLIEMARAASKLNPALGDVNYMYNSLTLGIKRGSPIILDNLGIVLKSEDAYEKYAEQLGITVDEMDAEAKRMAILNEALAQGAQMIEQAGGSAESATDTYNQWTTSVTNLKNAWAQQWMPVASSVVKVATDIITLNQRGEEMRQKVIKSLIMETDSWEELNAELGKYRMNAPDPLMAGRIHNVTEAEYELIKAEEERVFYTGLLANETLRYGSSLDEQRRAAEAAKKSEEELKEANDAFLDSLKAAVKGDFGKEIKDYADDVNKVQKKMADLRQDLAEKGAVEFMGTESEFKQYTALNDKLIEAYKQLDPLMNTYTALQEKRIKMDKESQLALKDEMDRLNKIIKIYKDEMKGLGYEPLIDEEDRRAVGELRWEYVELEKELQNLAEEHDKATKKMIWNLLAQQKMTDETKQEDWNQYLRDTAYSWGLIDEATLEAWEAVDEAKKAIEEFGYTSANEVLEAKKAVDDLATALEILPTDKHIRIVIGVEGDAGVLQDALPPGTPIIVEPKDSGSTYPRVPGGTTDDYPMPVRGKYAGGGSMVVPPGFPNDSYLVGVTSGEGVMVIPPHAMRGGRGGGVGGGGGDSFTINNYNAGAAAITMSMIEERRRERLNTFMGV